MDISVSSLNTVLNVVLSIALIFTQFKRYKVCRHTELGWICLSTVIVGALWLITQSFILLRLYIWHASSFDFAAFVTSYQRPVSTLTLALMLSYGIAGRYK